jgi:hypothetical protein
VINIENCWRGLEVPRAIVMIRPIKQAPISKDDLEDKLKKLVFSEEFLEDTGVIFEYYMRVFGWPDYVVSLYGANESLLKFAILKIREKCGDILTSTLTGVGPEDPYFRAVEYKTGNVGEQISKLELRGKERDYIKVLAQSLSLDFAREYISLKSVLLRTFDVLVKSRVEKPKGYVSKIDDRELIEEIFNLFFENRDITGEEKKEILKERNQEL